jgi:hypothetical protein
MAIRELLEDALLEPAIGITPRFRWHATPVGIAALCREEREFHQVKAGLVLLFHS